MAKKTKKQKAISEEIMNQDDITLDGMLTAMDNADFDCNYCVHLHDDNITCDAFPDLIPTEILEGDIAHNVPIKNDNGFQFEFNNKKYRKYGKYNRIEKR